MDKIFTIFDSKVGTHGPCMQFRTAHEALRHFSDIVNGQYGDGNISRHPGDYSLWEVAEIDVDTAEVVTQAKKNLGCGIDLVKGKENLQ